MAHRRGVRGDPPPRGGKAARKGSSVVDQNVTRWLIIIGCIFVCIPMTMYWFASSNRSTGTNGNSGDKLAAFKEASKAPPKKPHPTFLKKLGVSKRHVSSNYAITSSFEHDRDSFT
jgi:hypothetical protein